MRNTAALLLDENPTTYYPLPAGNPCASRKGRSSLLKGSVVVVGHGGSGKSETLGALLHHVQKDPTFVLLPAHSSQPPMTPLLREVVPGSAGTSTFWQQYWRTVLLVTIYLYLDADGVHTDADRQSLETAALLGHQKPRHLLPDVGSTARHVFTVFKQIVLLGNLLGRAIEAKHIGERLTEDEFRSIVSSVALIGGASQLAVAANQIISDEIPEVASDRDFTEVYTSIREYVESRAAELAGLLREAHSLEISAERLAELEATARSKFGGSDVGSVLWQNGLLGYREGDRAVFYSFDLSARFSLPRGHNTFVFHPAMRECAGLRPGASAVDPWTA